MEIMDNDSVSTMVWPAIVRSRITFDQMGKNYAPAANVSIEKELIANVKCYWIKKNGMEARRRAIIYLHGGCFALGSIRSHGAMVSHISDVLDTPILFIEYSLAPEHPFPQAINEILKVYKYIRAVDIYDEIIFMGDSAGAGLALHVISLITQKNMIRPSGLIMLSPWIDLKNNSNSIYENAAIDPILNRDQLEYFTSLYKGNTDLSKANPYLNMYGKFPPTLIVTASSEILLDDSKKAFSRIWETQPLTRLKIYENASHVFLLDSMTSATSVSALMEMKTFIVELAGHFHNKLVY